MQALELRSREASVIPAHHVALSRQIIDRANNRTRKERRVEKNKINSLPRGRLDNATRDDRPKVILSPTSSWNSISKGSDITDGPEWLGDGYSFKARP